MSTPPPPGASYPPYPQQPQQPGFGTPQYGPPQAPHPGQAPYQGQAPYPGQPPYGQQPGAPWGMPPMGPPPRKSNAGKVVGIVIGVVVGCFLVGGVVREFLPGAGASHSSTVPSGPRYTLTVPKTLDNGTYRLAQDISDTIDRQIPHDGNGMHGMKAVGGQYTRGTKSLTYTGLYGTIDDPDQALDNSIKGMNEGEGAAQPVPDREFTPEGDDTPVTCGVMTKDQAGTVMTVPFCGWADGSHEVSVMEVDGADPEADPASVDLQAFADKAGRIRDEVRVEAG
ncbi:hypothetical protein [Streptomyces ochraceiscleroticus]|uniref:Uncharacterized protein n=1 Tax=Streptomyces ochraceiscleroticus TaxID=47761 RepID=A0ABW1MBZ8_9ACTN|nr:hypothetical protein [Streptomyces ochraceiscleroticus]